MRSYNLNPEQAKQADNVGLRIADSGKYIGVFTRAEAITSKNDTEGIEFAFKATSNQEADFLTLWTHNKEGKEIYGLKQLNALMTCMKVRTLAPAQGQVEKWIDGAKAKVSATIYPELMGKKIGLLLQREEYQKNDGTIGSKFSIYACFDADTELVASEILDKVVSPVKLPKILATLKDRPMQARPAGGAPAASSTAGLAEMADDIPF
jgi:hypothetical protein